MARGRCRVVLAQPGGMAWNVFDGEILKLAHSFPDFCDAQSLEGREDMR